LAFPLLLPVASITTEITTSATTFGAAGASMFSFVCLSTLAFRGHLTGLRMNLPSVTSTAISFLPYTVKFLK
jgi:hypothetical protein